MFIRINGGPLAGVLALEFQAVEGVSAIGEYRLSVQSDSPSLDLAGLIGERVDLSVEVKDTGQRRPYAAWIVGARDTGSRQGHYSYEFELRNWWWFLDQSTDCRVFQHLSVPEICTQVFADYPGYAFRFELDEEYEPREYCVQYRESDYHFVARLLQVEGIYTRIEHHGDGDCTLVLSDSASYPDSGHGGAVQLLLPDDEEQRNVLDRNGVQRLRRNPRLRHSEVVLRDYNFHVPEADMGALSEIGAPAPGIKRENYHYCADYHRADKALGERRARVRLLAEAAQGRVLKGSANAANLECGKCFRLVDHLRGVDAQRYLLIATREHYVQDEPDSAASRGDTVSVSLEVVPEEVAYKAPLTLRKPAVIGTQSATVVGPENVEVHTDEHARVRVHFHWDRYHNAQDEDASCWMRVVQAWTGKGWGVISLPRVGTEVMINYLDGDIDRPVVVGQVFNGDHPPPYALPKDIRYTGLVSRSLRFGEPVNASQITFDDTREGERLKVHAERDELRHIERNRVLVVRNDAYEITDDTKTRGVKNEVDTKRHDANYQDVNVAYTEHDLCWTGEDVGLTGTDLSLVGVKVTFTGVANGVTGTSTTQTGTANSTTGISNALVGISTAIIGHSNTVTGLSNSFTRIAFFIVGNAKSRTGVKRAVTGDKTTITGTKKSTTGSASSYTAVSNSVTGVSISTTGMSISRTGISRSATGVSMSMKGVGISATGLSISFTGLSLSYTGVSMSKVGHSITL